MAEEAVNRAQVLPPPIERGTPLAWAQKNLFSNWWNSLLTLVSLAIIFFVLRGVITWVFQTAQWEVIRVNFRLLMVGLYPAQQMWRVWLCLHLLAAIVGLTYAAWPLRRAWIGAAALALPVIGALLVQSPDARLHLLVMAGAALAAYVVGRLLSGRFGISLPRRIAIRAWVLYFPLVLLIIAGLSRDAGPLRAVPSNFWGGLMLTFLLTIVGIVFSFPIGVLLALGRRSQLPVVKWTSIAYIELIRGVPLITILFMASTMVPLFLPQGVNIDRVLRAMVGITLFSSAYLAENVRGGLQAIPQGQYEAAHALGLSGFRTMRLIILPQALRLVIPVLVGQFIALFKDTTLVVTIGLLELLGISRSILAQPQFISNQHEVLVFITVIYWLISYFMSVISQRLEITLGVGQR